MEDPRPLKIYFLPFLSPGHLIPLSEMARLFAVAGEDVTIITTPANANLLHHSLSTHLVEFPSKEVGLPAGLENYFSVNDIETAKKLFIGMTLMQSQITKFIVSNPPDCIISDMHYPWTADTAAGLRIPRLAFSGYCIFAQSLLEALRSPNSPHRFVESDYDPFEIPGLPDRVVITRSQLPDYIQTPSGYTQLVEQWREAELKSYGILVNTFCELEPDYTEYYARIMGHKVWQIGPAGLIHRNAVEKVERGHKTVVGQHECLDWLGSKEPGSVLYVCFGSGCQFPDEQLYEVASGLASSDTQFIWVILGKDKDKDPGSDTEKWLPGGFEEMSKETGRGMIIRGWAPQVLILDHPSVGGFMTHCGWNSTMEAISAGVPMVTWPLYSEQFLNEKLVTQVLKIGVEVGAQDWSLWVDAGKKVMRREKIETAVRRVMDGGDEAMEMRKKAKELGEKARNAVKEGGSSHRNLMALIQDLRRLREIRLTQ